MISNAKKSKYRRGMTMLELVILVAGLFIMIIITGILIRRVSQETKTAVALTTVKQLQKAVLLMEDATGQWPGHLRASDIREGISGNEVWDLSMPAAGIEKTDGRFPNWNGPYVEIVARDPWGNHYFFDPDYDINPGGGEKWAAVVGSFGPNGIGRNVYNDADDIVNIIEIKR